MCLLQEASHVLLNYLKAETLMLFVIYCEYCWPVCIGFCGSVCYVVQLSACVVVLLLLLSL
jgi:hypothetical protein